VKIFAFKVGNTEKSSDTLALGKINLLANMIAKGIERIGSPLKNY